MPVANWCIPRRGTIGRIMTLPHHAAPARPSTDTLQTAAYIETADRPAPKYAEIALLALCLLLFFFRLGSVPLFDLDEGVYVSCARNMAISGDWVTPTLNSRPMPRPNETSVPFFEKPIFVYWCGAASMKLLGVTEFAARLPAALASLFTTLCIYYAGRRWFGRRAGLLAAAVYATAPMTLADARQLTTDSLLVLALTIALMSFWESGASGGEAPPSPQRSRLRFPLLFWVMCALAVLIKGAVGLLLPALVIVVNVLFERLRFRFRWAGRAPGEFAFGARWNRFSGIRTVVRKLKPLSGIVALLLITVPWHVVMLHGVRRDSDGRSFYQEYIIRQHIGRFRGGDVVHNAPLPTYFVYFLFGFFPWACFAPTAFRSPNYEGSPVNDPPGDAPRKAANGAEPAPLEQESDPFPWPSIAYVSKPEDAVHRFLLIWFWTIFVFFTIGAAKLPTYIVPAYPAAAILIGRWFDIALKDETRFPAMWRAIRGVVATAVLVLVVAYALPHEIAILRSLVAALPFLKSAIRIPQQLPVPDNVIAAIQHLSLALFVGSTAAWLALRNGEVAKWRRVGVVVLIGTMTLVLGIGVTEGYTAARVSILSPYQDAAADARVDAANGIPIVFYNIIPRRPSMLFYARSYSPIERKETPLLPYLNAKLSSEFKNVDVVLSSASLDNYLVPEAAAAKWQVTTLTQHGENPNKWLLVRLSR